MKITVLGAGMVGSAMAIDLAENHDVVCSDIDATSLGVLADRGIQVNQADLREPARIEEVISTADIVVNAVPGFMGFKTLEQVIRNGKDVVDIAFFPEDSRSLNQLAVEKGVIAVTDMGVAPGMCNVILGYHSQRMSVRSYLCLVGGLPVERTWPWEYKAPFSPCDVIEEYTRPARFRVNGSEITMPALSDPELIDFPGCGTLEAWNSDGLRSLLYTMPEIPDMKEKTLRWPGHIEKARILRDSGFFSKEPIDLNGVSVTPLEFTEKILFNESNWKPAPGSDEFTVMRVVVKGEMAGDKTEYTWELMDRYCESTGTSSMARTTGYACTAAVNAVASGLFRRKGISPAEYLGRDESCFRFMLDYLEKRNIQYVMKRTSSTQDE